jgi:hypothetical protein
LSPILRGERRLLSLDGAMRISPILLLLGLSVATAEADTSITLNPDKDNTLCQYGDSSNALGDLYVGRTNQSDGDSRRRTVIYFNVAGSLPSGATITSAKLRLYLNRTSDSTSRTLTLYKSTAGWGEGTSYFNGGQCDAPTTNDASWTYRLYSGSTWSSAGGDYSGTASQTCSVGTTFQYYEWASNSTMIADVQGWLDTPSGNLGWELIGDESTGQTTRRFTSREGAEEELPELVITYTTDSLRAGTASPRRTETPRLPRGLRYLATRDLDGDGELDALARDERRGTLVGMSRGVQWVIEAKTAAGDPLAR